MTLPPAGRRTLRAAIASIALLVTSADHPAGASSGFLPLTSAPEEVRFEFRGQFSRAMRTPEGGLSVEDSRHRSQPLGPWSEVPQASTWIALPPGAGSIFELESLESEPFSWPADMTTEERDRARAELLPKGGTVSPATWVRNQWGQKVVFSPVISGTGGELLYVTHAAFRLSADLSPGKLQPGRRAGGADPFEGHYRDLFLNYEQGRQWRRAQRPIPSATAGGGDYFSSTTQPWIKLHVSRHDLYQVSGQDLEGVPINLGSIEPGSLRLFSSSHQPLQEAETYEQAPRWMQEVPITVLDGEDGAFDPLDRILFYGLGPDGWYESYGVPPTPRERHTRDPYNEENVYWLTWGGTFEGTPKRLEEIDGSQVVEPVVTQVQDRLHLEEDRIWDARQKEARAEPPHLVPAAWERFWWRILSDNPNNTEATLTVRLPDPVPGLPVRVKARLWGVNNTRSTLPPPTRPKDHQVLARLNGALIADRKWDDLVHPQEIDTTGLWLIEGDQQFRFLLPFVVDPTVARRDLVYLAWVEMEYTRRLVARNDTLSFFAGGLSGVHSFEATGFGGDDLWVLEATDPLSPRWIRPEVTGEAPDRRVRFRTLVSESPTSRFLLRDRDGLPHPRLVLDPRPAAGYLRERSEAVQMVVVTHAEFIDPAEDLASHRRTHFPERVQAQVAVIDVQDICDEFAFGRMDPTAIRNFFQFARDAWTGGNPEEGPAYVLLLGDAHYDFRDHLAQGTRIYVPTYEGNFDFGFQQTVYPPQFASDDFYALLEGPDEHGLDLFVGRLPAETSFQARTMVDKTIAYEISSPQDPWKTRVTLVSDDTCQGQRRDALGFAHTIQTEFLADEIFPRSLYRDRIYLAEYGIECVYDTKPAASEALRTSMNEGTLVVNFTGHGSEGQLADERVFETSSVAGLVNRDRLFFFLTASCSVGKYDFSGEGLGEALVRHPGGGAVGVFSAASVASSSGNHDLNVSYFQQSFPDGQAESSRPLGVAASLAKDDQGIRLNARRYILLADPVVALATPRHEVRLGLTDAGTGIALADTLPRGALVDLIGEVNDREGHLLSDFDGEATVRVFDSQILRSHQVSGDHVEYELTGAPIFRGTATIQEGLFHLRFRVPAALRTGSRGFAQIYAYAEDGQRDASGVLDSLLVPETVPPPGGDQIGPSIQLGVSGDVEALPPGSAYTATFADSNGINITGLVPSRSVVLRIEEGGSLVFAEDVAARVSFGDDYQTASLSGTLPPNLASGRRYEMVLEASDNLNNRSSATLSFFLSGSGPEGFGLAEVFNLPNPTTGETRFFGQLNQEAEIEVKIFTLTGRTIASLGPTHVIPRQFQEEGLFWDGRDADGDRPANGVYFYKVSARPTAGGPLRSVLGRLVIAR